MVNERETERERKCRLQADLQCGSRGRGRRWCRGAVSRCPRACSRFCWFASPPIPTALADGVAAVASPVGPLPLSSVSRLWHPSLPTPASPPPRAAVRVVKWAGLPPLRSRVLLLSRSFLNSQCWTQSEQAEPAARERVVSLHGLGQTRTFRRHVPKHMSE